MEEYIEKISQLKNEIKSRDKDLHLAATYGKQLVEEKAKLSAQVEDLLTQKELLEQEKHSLQLGLEAKVQTIITQANELEFQRNEADKLLEKLLVNEKTNEETYKRNQNLLKENQYLKKMQEDASVENKTLQDKNNLLEKQIKNFEDQAEKSLCEAENDESQELQAQLNSYMLNNKELQEALSQLQCELEVSKKSEKHLLQIVKELEEAVSDRDSEIKGYIAEIKKSKEEIEELQGEIEVLKYDQVDTNRRGNSVFAELDDRRLYVEKEYKVLCKKYEHFKKNYDQNKSELDSARAQMAILQSMVSREYQQTYIDKLEESLSSAKTEIVELTHKLSKAVKKNINMNGEERNMTKESEYDYLRIMLKQSQKREKELQGEYMNLRMKNVYDNDKLTQTQHLLYKARQDLDSSKQEMGKLKLKIKDMEQGVVIKVHDDAENRKPRTEILDGFKPPATSEKNEDVKRLNVSLYHDANMIPGELELDVEEGFRQVKPPRKSNKFILQEFNRINKEKNEDSIITDKKDEAKEISNETEKHDQTIDQNQNQRFKSHSKISSRRMNDNCAQQ